MSEERIKEAISNIMYTSAGDVQQYNETIDAVYECCQIYLDNLVKYSNQLAANPSRIGPKDIIEATKADSSKQENLKSILSSYNNKRSGKLVS